MLDAKERAWEKERLDRVIQVINANIACLEDQIIFSLQRIKDSNAGMWNESKQVLHDFNDVVSSLVYLDAIKSDMQRYETFSRQRVKMLLLRKSAYFGRIDFQEDGAAEADSIYIGTSTLNDRKGDILIHDWRAAVCSMFYENEIGLAGYQSPDGFIQGRITRKRQYRIIGPVLHHVFDSPIYIEDEILQEILGSSKDERMCTIVSSIQKQQNEAIRDDTHSVVLVKGPAGSGKTSIALHRVAWLLYRHREKLSSQNIVIYSPNELFNDYVSEVLPQLGEENMRMSTFQSLAREFLQGQYQTNSRAQQIETLLLEEDPNRALRIRKKASDEFIQGLERYIDNLKEKGYTFRDVCWNEYMVVGKREIRKLFYWDFRDSHPALRLQKIKTALDRMLIRFIKEARRKNLEYLDKEPERARMESIRLREAFSGMRSLVKENTTPDFGQIYYRYLKSLNDFDMISAFKCSLKKRTLDYEDIAPVMYVKLLMGYRHAIGNIRNVLVDEIQDYTKTEQKVLFSIFSQVPMTLLGDEDQAIYVDSAGSLQLPGTSQPYVVSLEKSYRSTRQITQFCRRLLKKGEIGEYVNREGNPPRITQSQNLPADILLSIREMKDRGCRSMAVITRTMATAHRLLEELGGSGIRRILPEDKTFTTGTVLLPSYLAKGLEFDGVVVVSSREDPFREQEERALFYTCCSRALHELIILYDGDIPMVH